MDLVKDIIIPIISIIITIVIAVITTKITINNEMDKGKWLLLEIVKRYFISVKNCFDEKGIKNTDIERVYYLSELKNIENELNNISNNPLIIKLFSKYPSLTMTYITLIREVAKNENNDKIIINSDTIKAFYNLLNILEIQLPKNYFYKNPILKEFKDTADFIYNKVLEL